MHLLYNNITTAPNCTDQKSFCILFASFQLQHSPHPLPLHKPEECNSLGHAIKHHFILQQHTNYTHPWHSREDRTLSPNHSVGKPQGTDCRPGYETGKSIPTAHSTRAVLSCNLSFQKRHRVYKYSFDLSQTFALLLLCSTVVVEGGSVP